MDILINPSMILKNLKNILKTKINLKKKNFTSLCLVFLDILKVKKHLNRIFVTK
jgi:hypothetical protein